MEIIGWSGPEEVAKDVSNSIHSSLLKGELIFGYKNCQGDSDILELVIVANKDQTYGIGLITNGYTALLPAAPKSYFEILLGDMKTQKLNKKALETLKNIIENEILSN